MKFKKKNISLDEHLTTVKNLIEDSIKLRLRSDVPIGSCLSGGLDSSTIVGIASQMIQKKYNFRTFSSIYEDWFELSEVRYIDIVVRNFNLKAYYITPNLNHINQLFNKFIAIQDEPVYSYSQFTQYLVMKLAKEQNQKVLLDGQGADEIFAGYKYMNGYYLAELISKFKIKTFFKEIYYTIKEKNFLALKTFIFQFFPHLIKKHFLLRNESYLNSKFKKSSGKSLFYKSNLYNNINLNNSLISHFNFKLQDLLRWEDRNSMAFSIETRTPFLDHRLVTYVLALPSNYKIRHGINKWILRKVTEDIIPTEILQRKDKVGFAAPDLYWMFHHKNEIIKNFLTKPNSLIPYFINMTKLTKIFLNQNPRKKKKKWQFIFRVLCLNSWLNINFEET